MDDTERKVRRSTVVAATPKQVFDLLADPRRHAEFDGSGSVKDAVSGPPRLALGSKFGMNMKLGLPYRISNEVVEFDEDTGGSAGDTWATTSGATS